MDFSPFQQVKLIFVKHEKYGNCVYIYIYQIIRVCIYIDRYRETYAHHPPIILVDDVS